MSIAEMEGALASRPTKRLPERVRAGHAPQTARALLEENRQLIEEKRERKALARKSSREFVERLLAQDRLTTEGDKAKAIGRRQAQRELAQYYKAKIAEKETVKASEYHTKVASGVEIQYFPFVEGENINKNREAKSAQMRDEMRSFLQKQRDANPPRTDVLLAETNVEHAIKYPLAPGQGLSGPTQAPNDIVARPAGDAVAQYMSRHPRFLSRSREHMSRRLHDAHVRKALEDKVQQTKAELESASQQRQAELQQWEEGMLVNDALRYDSSQAKAAERRRHAQFLRAQMHEQRAREERQQQERHAEIPGYFGPEEKEVLGGATYQEHCADLVKQMGVDQQRRASSRHQRLRQEQRLIDNCMAEMSQDREKERQKMEQHRAVLTTTWKSQQRIKDAVKSIDAL